MKDILTDAKEDSFLEDLTTLIKMDYLQSKVFPSLEKQNMNNVMVFLLKNSLDLKKFVTLPELKTSKEKFMPLVPSSPLSLFTETS